MENYIMYLRKSQMDRDFESGSVEETLQRHRTILTEFCQRQKLNVVEVLEEVVSGESLAARPQMIKALDLINTGKYAGIVCMDHDRLSRGSGMDSGYIMQVLQINNCKIVTPQKTYDLSDESDQQFTDMKFLFSRYELRQITKRLIRGRDQSAAEGRYCGSVAPYGYAKIKIQGEKGFTLQIIPEEAKVIRMIYNMYTEEKMGVRQIAFRLNDLGIKTKKDCEWSYGVIIQILDNVIYTGKIRWKYHKDTKQIVDGKITFHRTKDRKDYLLYDGLHEPIITIDQWEKAQEIRHTNNPAPVRSSMELTNPFAGLLFCSGCGKPIRRNTGRSKDPRYKCQNEGHTCKCKSIQTNHVEAEILRQMREWLDGYMVELKQQPVKNHADDLKRSHELLKRQIDDLSTQQDKICDMLERGVYTVQMFQKRNDVITTEMTKLRESMTKLEAEILDEDLNQSKHSQVIPAVIELLSKYDDLTASEKNILWKQCIEKIFYFRSERGGNFDIKIFPKLPKSVE